MVHILVVGCCLLSKCQSFSASQSPGLTSILTTYLCKGTFRRAIPASLVAPQDLLLASSQGAGRLWLSGIVGTDAMSSFEIVLTSDGHLGDSISSEGFAVSFE